VNTGDRWFSNRPVVHSENIQAQCPSSGHMCFQLGTYHSIPGLHPIRGMLGAFPITCMFAGILVRSDLINTGN
jgi:hypothetical protein